MLQKSIHLITVMAGCIFNVSFHFSLISQKHLEIHTQNKYLVHSIMNMDAIKVSMLFQRPNVSCVVNICLNCNIIMGDYNYKLSYIRLHFSMLLHFALLCICIEIDLKCNNAKCNKPFQCH